MMIELTKKEWLLTHPPRGGVEDEGADSDGLADLIKEGNEEPSAEVEEKSDESSEKGDETKSPSSEELATELAAAKAALAEKDAELVYHRGRSRQPEKVEVKGEEKPLIDMEELTAKLTSRDPKVAAQAVVEVAQKLVAAEAAKTKTEVTSTLRTNQQINSAKEEDRRRTYADFGDSMEDPQFVALLEKTWEDNARASGGVYLPNMLYGSAAVAEKIYNKQKALKAKTKNGVTPVRTNGGVGNPVESDTADYTKAKTIAELPDKILSLSDKAAARAVVKRMGITEADYVKTLLEEKREDAGFGRY